MSCCRLKFDVFTRTNFMIRGLNENVSDGTSVQDHFNCDIIDFDECFWSFCDICFVKKYSSLLLGGSFCAEETWLTFAFRLKFLELLDTFVVNVVSSYDHIKLDSFGYGTSAKPLSTLFLHVPYVPHYILRNHYKDHVISDYIMIHM